MIYSQQEDVKMKDFVRARVSAVVGTPSTAFRDPNNHSNGQSDSDKKPRFLFDGAESILAASTALLKEYDNIENVLAKGIDKDTEQIRKNGSDDQKEAEALIRTGKAVAMRRVQKAVDGKTSLDINETNAKLAATQFGEDKPVDQTLLHTLGNAERGIGRLMKNLPSE